MSKGKVLIAAPVHPVLTDGLAAAGYSIVEMPAITQSAATTAIADCTGVITSTRLQLNKDLIDAASQLKWIGRMGSGMEVIDVPYATSKGIQCYSSPEGNSNAVAEHALGMLLALNKRILKSANEVRDGKWPREENRGFEIEGKTIAIIGFGHTGQAFARVLKGLGATILAYDIITPLNPPKYVSICTSLELIFNGADIVSFHVPISEKTRHYVNRDFIQEMARPFILINTSRGEVVDSSALQWGIETSKISGACLDVWEGEPLEKMQPHEQDRLRSLVILPNVIITPHIAGYTHEALFKMSKILLVKVL